MQKNFETLEFRRWYLSEHNIAKQIVDTITVGKIILKFIDSEDRYYLPDGEADDHDFGNLIQKVEVTIAPVEQKKEIKLFVGAVCRLDDRISIITHSYGDHFNDYSGIVKPEEVIEILNPEATYNKE